MWLCVTALPQCKCAFALQALQKLPVHLSLPKIVANLSKMMADALSFVGCDLKAACDASLVLDIGEDVHCGYNHTLVA